MTRFCRKIKPLGRVSQVALSILAYPLVATAGDLQRLLLPKSFYSNIKSKVSSF
jgi:hypothetical protein